MNCSLPLVSVLIGLTIFSGLSISSVDAAVGVKAGDWIEYHVITAGTPPSTQDVQWARMDIIEVIGNTIKVNVTTQANNGTYSNNSMQLNLERGEIGAWFIIPANLTIGETFYDLPLGRNFTIEGEQQLSFAGAMRTVTNCSTPERIKQWDKETGIFLQCIDNLPGYTINATAIRTNLWNTESSNFSQTSLFVAFITSAIIIVAAILAVSQKKDKV